LPKTLKVEVIEKEVNQIKKAMKTNDTISAGFSLFGLFLAFIEVIFGLIWNFLMLQIGRSVF